jgi:hypothetical protein
LHDRLVDQAESCLEASRQKAMQPKARVWASDTPMA